MLDDFNSPVAIAHLFDGVKIINSAISGKASYTGDDIQKLRQFFKTAVEDILGLATVEASDSGSVLTGKLIDFMLQMRIDARASKDFALSDSIRDELTRLGVEVMDTKDGFDWKLKA